MKNMNEERRNRPRPYIAVAVLVVAFTSLLLLAVLGMATFLCRNVTKHCRCAEKKCWVAKDLRVECHCVKRLGAREK